MKSILFIALISFFSVASFAAEKKSTVAPAKIESAGENAAVTGSANNNLIKTEMSHNFDDILVQGQYHFSNEAVTTVEEDKVLDALIGVRSDFKDRLEKSSTRY